MTTYTVIGVWQDDTLVIAGVAEGSVPMVDNGPDIFGPQRYAGVFVADCPDDAERLAQEAAQ